MDNTLKYFEDDVRILEQQLHEARQRFKNMVSNKVWSKGMMYYDGFVGTIENTLNENGVSYGKIVGIPDLVTYEEHGNKNIQEVFENAVDDYILMLEELGCWDVLDKGSVL